MRLKGLPAGAAVIPALAAISLGVIPTVANETWGALFSLSRPRATLGKASRSRRAGLARQRSAGSVRSSNLSPNRTAAEVRTHPRTTLHFADFADQAEAIGALAQR